MKILCTSFQSMKARICSRQSKVIFIGAGVVGQITAPQIFQKYGLLESIDCYLDNDSSKWGTSIAVFHRVIPVNGLEYLTTCDENTVILINISRFAEVKEQLEQMECTKNMTAYIMPMMCIHNMCSEVSGGSPVLSEIPLIPKKIHYMWLGRKEIPSKLHRFARM